MKYTYLLLNVLSLSIPLLYSFHPKMKLIRWWKPIVIALSITAVYYLIWDVIFTKYGFWGFNDAYLTGIRILRLPVEEWLFFWFIPYPSLFIYFSLQYFKPEWVLSEKITQYLSSLIIFATAVTVIFFFNRWYTLVNSLTVIAVLTYASRSKVHLLQRFYLAFIIVLIPFTLVNGALTGMFTEEPVVWYNNMENMGIRFISIPLEDFGYAFSMLLLSLILIDNQVKIQWKNNPRQ